MEISPLSSTEGLLSQLLTKILLTASCSDGSWYNTPCQHSAYAMTEQRQEIKGSTHGPQLRSGMKQRQLTHCNESCDLVCLSSLFPHIKNLKQTKNNQKTNFKKRESKPEHFVCEEQTQFGHCSWSLSSYEGKTCTAHFNTSSATLPPAPVLKWKQIPWVYFAEAFPQS